MSEFDKWFKSLNENGKTVYLLGNEHKVSKMAWDFQQAKIDSLNKNIEALHVEIERIQKEYQGMFEGVQGRQKTIDELQAKYDELNNRATGIALDQMATTIRNQALQGRIDEALKELELLNYYRTGNSDNAIKILKGNSHES